VNYLISDFLVTIVVAEVCLGGMLRIPVLSGWHRVESFYLSNYNPWSSYNAPQLFTSSVPAMVPSYALRGTKSVSPFPIFSISLCIDLFDRII